MRLRHCIFSLNYRRINNRHQEFLDSSCFSIGRGITMKKAILVGFLVLISFGLAWAVWDRNQSVSKIDQTLKEIRHEISIAEKESEKFSGGLILVQIKYREQILKTTEAMLEQKRASFLHRINLSYVINGKAPDPITEEQLSDIKADMERLHTEIIEGKEEASKYSGGFIKAMILSKVATTETTLAYLQQRFYTAKHGIPLNLGNGLGTDANLSQQLKPKEPMGKIVKDDDAL